MQSRSQFFFNILGLPYVRFVRKLCAAMNSFFYCYYDDDDDYYLCCCFVYTIKTVFKSLFFIRGYLFFSTPEKEKKKRKNKSYIEQTFWQSIRWNMSKQASSQAGRQAGRRASELAA